MPSLMRDLVLYLTAFALAAAGLIDCAAAQAPDFQAQKMNCHEVENGYPDVWSEANADPVKQEPLPANADHDCVKKCQLPALARAPPEPLNRVEHVRPCRAEAIATIKGIYVEPPTPPPRPV